jgi:peptidyl-prolyl cis-trans isomerase C
MCRILLVVLCAFAGFSSLALAGQKESSKTKAAVVNGSVITQAELDSQMNMILDRLQNLERFPGVSELAQIKMQVLENLIARELLYQESQRKGITVDHGAVDAQLGTLKAQFPDEAEFQNALKTMNLTESGLRFKVERDLAIRKLVDDQIARKITVSDKEMRDYYESNPETFQTPEQVRASHILIKVDPMAEDSQKTEALDTISRIQQKLQKGEDFSALATEYSQGPSGPKGGDVGYFSRGQMVKPFEDAAFAMKPGEVSGMVETRFGYHLIKVTDKSPETKLSYEEVKEKLAHFLRQRKVQQEIEPYVKDLEKDAKIERLVQKNESKEKTR